MRNPNCFSGCYLSSVTTFRKTKVKNNHLYSFVVLTLFLQGASHKTKYEPTTLKCIQKTMSSK